MAKKKTKRTQPNQPKGWLISPRQVDAWLDLVSDQLRRQDYVGAEQTCRRVLRYAPPKSQARAEALEHLATACAVQHKFKEAYEALSGALEINPNEGYLWYNRALNARFTARLAQSVFDLEKAVELETDPAMRQKFHELLVESRQMAESDRALRGPDFTLEQLVEQQEWFNQGVQLMEQGQWLKAEAAFHRVIEMGEGLPQPHGNLGLALLMQKKYDEAEAAFKRALEIDPNYDLAKQNLAQLPETRASGEIPLMVIRNPFDQAKVSLMEWEKD